MNFPLIPMKNSIGKNKFCLGLCWKSRQRGVEPKQIGMVFPDREKIDQNSGMLRLPEFSGEGT